MLKRRLKLLGKILLGCMALGAAFLLIERWRGQIALASYKKQLVAKGEKLTPEDFIKDFKAEDNGAPAVVAAIKKLQDGLVLPANPPFLKQPMASGRAKINFREPFWISKTGTLDGDDTLFTNHWEQLAQDLATNSKALAEVRRGLNQPVLNNDLNYALGSKVKLPHLAPAKSVLCWFSGETQLALRAGDQAAALQGLLSLLRLQALVENDHFTISELVRYAFGAITRSDTWEALQADGWTEAELSQLQNAWAVQNYVTGVVQALERDLMSQVHHHQLLRSSNDEAYQLLEMLDLFGNIFDSIRNKDETYHGSGFWQRIPYSTEVSEFFNKQVYCRIWRFAWSHQAELKDLKTVYAALELSRRVISDLNFTPIKAEIRDWLNEGEHPGIYSRIRYLPMDLRGAYEKLIFKAVHIEIGRSHVITAIALKRFHLRYGQYPDKLELLVPEFCSTIPTDWMDGKPIKYRRNEDGSYTLYSVGQDGKDEGGDLRLSEQTRNKDWWFRRDYVWPAPATPEEVEEYRREAGKN